MHDIDFFLPDTGPLSTESYRRRLSTSLGTQAINLPKSGVQVLLARRPACHACMSSAAARRFRVCNDGVSSMLELTFELTACRTPRQLTSSSGNCPGEVCVRDAAGLLSGRHR